MGEKKKHNLMISIILGLLASTAFALPIRAIRPKKVSSDKKEQIQSSEEGKTWKRTRLDKVGKTMEYVRPRIQYYDICYAHTAADMVDSLRYSGGDERLKLRTSPLYAAIKVSQELGKGRGAKSFEIGNICKTVNHLIQDGLKDFKGIDRRIFQNVLERTDEIGNDTTEDSKKLAYFFKDIHHIYRSMRLNINENNLTGKALDEEISKSTKELQRLLEERSFFKSDYGLYLPKEKIELALRKNSYLNFLGTLMKSYSPHTYKVEVEQARCSAKIVNHKNFVRLRNAIHQHFEQKNALPIGLDFCESLLTKGFVGKPGKGCVRHAATIIGQRKGNDGRWQVLIKNSSSCEKMAKKYECEEGHKIWVPVSDVLRSSFSLHFLIK